MSKYSELPEERKESLRKANRKYVEKNYKQVHLNLKKDTFKQWSEEAQKRGFENLASFIRSCVDKVIGGSVDDSNNIDL